MYNADQLHEVNNIITAMLALWSYTSSTAKRMMTDKKYIYCRPLYIKCANDIMLLWCTNMYDTNLKKGFDCNQKANQIEAYTLMEQTDEGLQFLHMQEYCHLRMQTTNKKFCYKKFRYNHRIPSWARYHLIMKQGTQQEEAATKYLWLDDQTGGSCRLMKQAQAAM